MAAHVYILAEEGSDRPVKIGLARNVARRMLFLQGGNSRRLVLCGSRACANRLEARAIEASMHATFGDSRLVGEWFAISASVAVKSLASAEPLHRATKPQPYPELAHKIECFLDQSGMTATAFGLKVAGDGNLVRDLRCGREMRRATRDRILNYIATSGAEPLVGAA